MYDYDTEGMYSGTSVDRKCWYAPHSMNRQLPPLKGWIPCDPLAKGNPTIALILRDSIEYEDQYPVTGRQRRTRH